MRSAALRKFVAEQALAPPGENGGGLERGDLIRPTGAVLKFIHSDDPEDKNGPKFEASFEVRGSRGNKRWGGERESSGSRGVLALEACCLFWVCVPVVFVRWVLDFCGGGVFGSFFCLGSIDPSVIL